MALNVETRRMWKNVEFTTNEQINPANLFKSYEEDESLTRNELLDTIREDFSLLTFSRLEVQVNYDIYKKVRTFLESRSVSIPASADGTQSIMVRMEATICPEETQDKAESYERYLALKRGEIDLNPPNSEITPRQAQRTSLLYILNTISGTGQEELARTPRSAYRPAEMMQSATHRSEAAYTPSFATNPATLRSPHGNHLATPGAASKVMSRYSQDRQRFGGSTQDNWTMSLAKYERMASELGMSPAQKLQLIHHMFRDDAEHFYYDELQDVPSWEEMVQILDKRYNGPARQQSIIDEVRTMTIQDFAAGSEHEGNLLQRLARGIERLVPQCISGRNGDQDKQDALYYAIRSCEWSSGPITSLSTQADKPYKQFLDELATAEQNHRIGGGLKGNPLGTAAPSDSLKCHYHHTLLEHPTDPHTLPPSGSRVKQGTAEIPEHGKPPTSPRSTTGVATTATARTTS